MFISSQCIPFRLLIAVSISTAALSASERDNKTIADSDNQKLPSSIEAIFTASHLPAERTSDPSPEPERIEYEQIPMATQSEAIKEVILAQLNAIKGLDSSKAYYAYSTADFQDMIPLETFKLFVRKNRVFSHNDTFAMQGLTFSGIVATVKGTLTSIDGVQAHVQYDLIQENGKWKIRKIELSPPTPLQHR